MPHDPSPQRKQTEADDFALNRDAIRWLAQLPDEVRPIELGREFPRIVNTIAAKWADFNGCRQGFQFVIVQEICALREYFDTLYPPPKDAWQQALDADKR
jgi:hypothetical protein